LGLFEDDDGRCLHDSYMRTTYRARAAHPQYAVPDFQYVFILVFGTHYKHGGYLPASQVSRLAQARTRSVLDCPTGA